MREIQKDNKFFFLFPNESTFGETKGTVFLPSSNFLTQKNINQSAFSHFFCTFVNEMKTLLPAEWEPQWGVQLTWPHEETDWKPYLKEITDTYLEMARAITQYEMLLAVAPDISFVRQQLIDGDVDISRVVFHQCPTNDTWARDHGFITLERRDERGEMVMLDFCFNGWGQKFEAEKDNAINRSLFPTLISHLSSLIYESCLDFVLEGGSIESDGKGTIFTTSSCLLAPNRNQPLTREQIEEELKKRLHAERIMWIDHGHLTGDDTDGHIDTLAQAFS